jgi:hypothetical protein
MRSRRQRGESFRSGQAFPSSLCKRTPIATFGSKMPLPMFTSFEQGFSEEQQRRPQSVLLSAED